MHALVETVLGPVEPGALGVVLCHEHLFLDLRKAWFLPPTNEDQRKLADARVTMETLGALRREPLGSRDNLVLDSAEMLASELASFSRTGGGAVVDVTCQGMGRAPERLRELSRRTNVHIIASTGHYVRPCHPSDLDSRSVDEIAAEYIEDIQKGIKSTGIRAGMIGEIGLSLPIHPVEQRVLRAAALAQIETGAALSIHPPWPTGLKTRCVELLKKAGARLDRTIICHCDLEEDMELLVALANEGIILGFDTFGHEHYRDRTGKPDPRDTDRINRLVELIQRGHVNSIVLSQDLACKIECKAYGGWGLTHLDDNIVPALRDYGISDAEIAAMRVRTPARLLGKWSPSQQ